jgi:hypothetical protein
MAEGTPRLLTVLVEPERSDPWLRHFGRPGMTWCVLREVADSAGADAATGVASGDGELESLVDAWLTRATVPGTDWVAELSGSSAEVARAVERLPRRQGDESPAGAPPRDASASTTLTLVVDPWNLHPLVWRAWESGLTLALLRVPSAAVAETVSAMDRGDDGSALSLSDRVLVCQPAMRWCSIGVWDPDRSQRRAEPVVPIPVAAASARPRSAAPHREQASKREVPWIVVGGLLAAGLAVGLVALLGRGSAAPGPVGGVLSISTTRSTSATPTTSPTAVTTTVPATPQAVPASVHVSSSPTARTGEATAFDISRDQGVLFGGTDSATQVLGDTWAFSQHAWQEVHPRTSPPARTGAAMTFNPATAHVVLVGGVSASGTPLDDTWVWDGTTWSVVGSSIRPTAGAPIGIAYDDAVGSLVLLTRAQADGSPQTWVFAGGTWRARTSGTAPTAGPGSAMAYDDALKRLVLVDLAGAATWQWDGTVWTRTSGPTFGSGSTGRVAFDTATQRLVLVGLDANKTTAWAYDGSAWLQVVSPVGPVTVAALVSTATSAVAFGGPTPAADLTEAWVWSAAGWGG